MGAPRYGRRSRGRFWEPGDAGQFHWCDYWGIWSKVLSVEITESGMLRVREQDLTSDYRGRVRTHGTELGQRDLLVAKLPEGVEDIP